jgi:hypothetical protein
MPSTCPINIAVVTLPPQQINGFSWGGVIRPMNDPCLGDIAVEPTNDSAWYVGSANGLYMTKDGGQTWTKPLGGNVGPILLVPGRPQLVYVGIEMKLYLSRDHGTNWTLIHTFDHPVWSLLVGGERLHVGLAWGGCGQPSGVYISNLGAASPVLHPFGPGQSGLLVWTIARDPNGGTLYAGTEIYNHPQPYQPPFFRSTDGGMTWTNVAGIIPWHVYAAAVRPNDGYVYALTEGLGLYGSANKGAVWQPPAPLPSPTVSLLMHPKKPTHLFGGQQRFGTLTGGVFLSVDAGKVFKPIGLAGVTVSGLAVNGACTRLFASTYGSGIYKSPLPASA